MDEIVFNDDFLNQLTFNDNFFLEDKLNPSINKLQDSIENLEENNKKFQENNEKYEILNEEFPETHCENKETSKTLGYFTFLVILVIIIISWILIELWGKVIENLAYNTFGLNPNSTIHALIVAVVVTLVFLIILYCIDEDNKIRDKMTPLDRTHVNLMSDII